MEKDLTKAEKQIIHTLWTLKQGLRKVIPDSNPRSKLPSNTLVTILKRLTMSELVNRYLGSSPAKLVSRFPFDEKLPAQELEHVLQQIKSFKTTNPCTLLHMQAR